MQVQFPHTTKVFIVVQGIEEYTDPISISRPLKGVADATQAQ
jgi:hypothetical protein